MPAKSALRLVSVFVVLSLAQVPALYGQPLQFVFEHLTSEDGLPSNTVGTAILQDHLGFLWIGTWRGLVRYDGYSMAPFYPNEEDSASVIASLYEDETGVLWIGAGRGSVYRFDRSTEGFTRFVLDDGGDNERPGGQIQSITEDRDGRLWLIPSGRDGLLRLDPRTGDVTHYRHDPSDPTSVPDNRVEALLEDRSGRLWVGTRNGLGMLDSETGAFSNIRHDPGNPNSLSHSNTNALLEDRHGLLWIGTWGGGLNRFDPSTSTFTRFRHDPEDPTSLSHDVVHFIHEDRSGLLWIGTVGGLNRFDAASGTFTHFLPVPDAPQGSGHNSILSHFEDREGLFWLTTPTSIQQQGQLLSLPDNPTRLYSFDPSSGTFVWHRQDPQDPNSFDPGMGIRGIYQDRTGTIWISTATEGVVKVDRFTISHYPFGWERVRAIGKDREGTLWIGTGAFSEIPQGGALHRLDPTTGEVTSYRYDPDEPTSLSRDFVMEIFEDSRGRLWVASLQGLELFDPATGTFTHPYKPYRERVDPRRNQVQDIVEDREGTLWISTWMGGLHRFDTATRTFRSFGHNADDPDTIPTNWLTCLRFDQDGILWIGTNYGGGLLRFDPATERFTSYSDLAPGLVKVSYIHEDRKGRLWLATQTKGLLRFDSETGDVTTFTTHDGLVHNEVTGILEDRHGQLWLSTVAGLSRFDPEEGTFSNYDEGDGLQGRTFIDRSAFKDSDGNLYFGGRHGLNIVDPDRVRDNPQAPQVVLTELRALDRELVPSEQALSRVRLSGSEPVQLTHRQNDITFEFVALHFSRPEKNRYSYRLNGYDRTWSEPGTQRTATYTNLAPGSYTFRVKAANAYGIWNEEGASVRLMVVPPWWRTWWAYLVYGLLLVGGAFAVDRVQRRRVQEAERRRASIREAQLRADLAEEHARRVEVLDDAKTRFFANISHEFRTPLTLIMGPVQDALASHDAPALSRAHLRLIRQNTRRLLRLVKQLFDLSKLESNRMKLNRQPGDLGDFVRTLVRTFAPLAERRRITLQYRAEAEVRRFSFDREALEKVFSNLLSNALKFTPEGGKVWVTVHARGGTDEESVEVVVKDTGPGIAGAELERIFDRFEQVDGSATRAHEGMGLGLALARELVELHGGALRVDSELGFGSAFIVWLPLGVNPEAPMPEVPPVPETTTTDDGAAELEAAALLLDFDGELDGKLDGKPAEEGPASASDKSVVLVVEDNRDVRQLLRDYLGTDYHVLEAADGEAGLEAARQHRPDLVLSDVMMPRMDGYALCRALKADETLRTIPVMLLTAKVSEEDRLYGLEGGADDYLSKPFSRRELEVRVANLILSRRQLRQQFSREIQVRPSDVVIQPEDEAFLEQVLDVLEAHLSDSAFTTDGLADALGMSRRQAERRVKDVTGETPPRLLRRMRLERAAQLLKARPGSISEVAYTVGFKTPSHFAKVFREKYGVSPSEHIENTT